MNTLAEQLRAKLNGPGVGHNAPPSPIGDDTSKELQQRLERDYAEWLDRVRDLELGIGRLPKKVENDADAGKITDFIAKQVRPATTEGEDAHEKESRPFLSLKRVCDAFFLHRKQHILKLLEPANKEQARYVAAKRDQLRREQEEARHQAEKARLKAEADAAKHRAAAALMAPTNRQEAKHLVQQAEQAEADADAARKVIDAPDAKAQIRGDYGAVGYLREAWDYEVIVPPWELPWKYLMVKDSAIRADIAAGMKEHPCLRIFDASKFVAKG